VKWRHGLDLWADHRSHRDRGLEIEPTEHLGPSAAGMERRGERSERGDINRDIQARNVERERLNREAGQITAEIIDLASERAKRARPEPTPAEAADQAGGQGTDRPRRSAEEVLAAITGRQAAFTWRGLNRQLAKEIADPTLCALATDELCQRQPEIA
jgi:hypothetical protein